MISLKWRALLIGATLLLAGLSVAPNFIEMPRLYVPEEDHLWFRHTRGFAFGDASQHSGGHIRRDGSQVCFSSGLFYISRC